MSLNKMVILRKTRIEDLSPFALFQVDRELRKDYQTYSSQVGYPKVYTGEISRIIEKDKIVSFIQIS